MPTLNRVVGSPAPIKIAQGRPVLVELAAAAAFGGGLPLEWSLGVCRRSAVSTKAVLFVRTRAGRASSTSGGRPLEDLFGIWFWAVFKNERDDDDGDMPS